MADVGRNAGIHFIVHPEAYAGVSGLDNTIARRNYHGNVEGSYLRM
jgi:hypothetical protein